MPRTAAASFLAAWLLGCVTYQKPLPALAPRSAGPPRTFALSSNARQVALKTVVVDLPVGHVFGEIAWGYSGSCLQKQPLVNTQGRFDLDLGSYRDLFVRVMSGRGYPVDDGLEMFKDSNERVPDLQVAAKVVDASINECFPNYNRNKLQVRGTAYLKVAWSVYSPLEKKIVFAATTEGSTYATIESSVGEQGLIRAALEDATERLAATPDFKDVVDPPASPARAVAESLIRIRRSPAFTGDLKRNMDAIRNAVATITSNKGSGSGFVVSEDGKVITAEHVVAGSRFVKATTSTGRECYGEVLAASKQRDLALVGLECHGLTALPLAREGAVQGNEVFAIGTPLSDKLAFSVTKGVVSAIRTLDRLQYIQSDVTVLPGSSGGPLLDAHGNAIGVTTSGVAVGAVPVGVNFFVPVTDIEKFLPVQLD